MTEFLRRFMLLFSLIVAAGRRMYSLGLRRRVLVTILSFFLSDDGEEDRDQFFPDSLNVLSVLTGKTGAVKHLKVIVYGG